MLRKIVIGVGLTAVMALAASACGSSGGDDAGTGQSAVSSGSSSSAQPTSNNSTFTYSTYTEVMIDWDPASAYATEIMALNSMYDTLTKYDITTEKVVPALATKWESNDDGTVWTYHLRDDAVFHSGRKVDSEAVKESIERTKSVGTGAAYEWDAVKSIDTPDATTVVFNLSYAQPMDLITSATYSAFIYDTQAASGGDLTDWFKAGNEAGSGPYTLGKWDQGKEVELTLKKFDDYWGGWDGAHYSNVIFRVIREDSTAAQLMRAGQVDFVEKVKPELWKSFENDQNVSLVSSPSWQNLILYFNTASGPLAAPNVRQAVAEGIDYDGIATALKGAAIHQAGIIPEGLFGYDEKAPTRSYNPDHAKQVLEEAGFGPSGKALKLDVTYTQGDSNEQLVTTLMKSTLADLNITLNVRPLQTSTKYAESRSTNPQDHPDMTMLYWWPDYPDPYSWFVNLVKTQKTPEFNFAYYSNPKMDELIDGVEPITATDRDKALGMYQQMQQLIFDDVPVVALYTVQTQRLVAKSVGGFVENPAYPEVVFPYELTPEA